MLLPKIIEGDFQLVVTVVNPGDFKANVQGMVFEVVTVKRSFTQFQLGLRYSFVAVNFMFLIAYILHYRSIPKGSRVIEQKCGILLCVSLLFFNDP